MYVCMYVCMYIRKAFYTKSNSQAAEWNKVLSFNWSAAKKTDFDNALEVNYMVLKLCYWTLLKKGRYIYYISGDWRN